jgi:hypothetical protein
MVVQTFNPSVQETKTIGFQVQGHSELHSKTCLTQTHTQKETKKRKENGTPRTYGW